MGNAEALAWGNTLVLKTMWRATVQDSYSLHCQQLSKLLIHLNDPSERSKTYIVCSIAVVVYTAEKGSGSIPTNVLGQKMPAAWMFIKEVGHIMNETSNGDQGTRLGLGLVYLRVNEKRHVSTQITHSSPS